MSSQYKIRTTALLNVFSLFVGFLFLLLFVIRRMSCMCLGLDEGVRAWQYESSCSERVRSHLRATLASIPHS